MTTLNLKEPIPVIEQVRRLIKHKMDITDIDYAKQILSEVNYYRFTGYAYQFRDKHNPDDYLPRTKFNSILRLYEFDGELRCILKSYLDLIELYMRSQIAHGFAMTKCLNPPHTQHYDSTNFYNKISHAGIFSSLKREKLNSRDSLFVIHHDKKYKGKMPLWVIVELLSFTNLSKLYSAMYYSEQDLIAVNIGITKETLRNHLHCLANLRNKVAHAGRLYNVSYNPPVMLGRTYLKQNPDINSDTLFAYLIVLMRRLPRKADKAKFAKEIKRVMCKYRGYVQLPILGFPVDYKKRLGKEVK